MAKRKPKAENKRQCNKCAAYFNPDTIDGAVHLASCREYNGWKNYETWKVALCIDNDVGSYRYWRGVAAECNDEGLSLKLLHETTHLERTVYLLSKRLKDEFSDNAPALDGTYGDLLGAALDEVDWHAISENLLEE